MVDLVLRPLGAAGFARLNYAWALFWHLAGTLTALARPEGRSVVRRITLYQIFFTGVDAVWVVSGLASILGALVIIETLSVVTGAGGDLLLAAIMELVVVRELGPLMTAVIVIGRSGSSITVELGNMKVAGEIELLDAMGIDVQRYLVMPRLLGVTSAIFCLCLIFDAVAILGGYAVARIAIDTPVTTFLTIVGGHLTLTDMLVTLVKTVLFGVVIATLSTWHGLAVGPAITEVPQATRKSVVHSLVACLVLNGMISLAAFSGGY